MGISGVRTVSYPWASEHTRDGAQVDLVIERADGICDLCEMEFTDAPLSVTAKLEAELLHKRAVYSHETGTRHALKLVMIASAGIAGIAHTEHISQVITLDNFFHT